MIASGLQPAWLRLGVVLVSVALALVIRLALGPLIGERSPFLAFTIAVLVSAGVGGRWPGLLATVLGALVGTLLLLPPYGSLRIADVQAAANLGLFLVVGITISYLTGVIAAARQQAAGRLLALHQSQTRFQQLFAAPIVGFFELRIDGLITDANDAFLEMLGYSRTDFHAKRLHWDTLTPAEYRAADAQALDRLVVRRSLPPYQKEFIHRDGHRVAVLLGATMHDGDERALVVVVDVTELRQTEIELRASEQRFRAVFEQAAVGIALVGLDGRWLQVNRRLCEILGYDSDELLTLSFQEITHPDDLEADLHLLEQLVAGAIPSYALEKRYICKNGARTWVALTVALVRTADGAPEYCISVIRDINDRKQAQAELEQLTATLEQRVQERTAQLQAANEALETFSYLVSHDLRAPLRTMQGLAEALRDDVQDLTPVAQSYVRLIADGASQMNTLIGDLLLFSQINRADLLLLPQSLDQAVAAALEQIASADGAQARAQIEVASVLPPVCAHFAMLVQVIVNLLTNARKFVAPATTPQVRVWAEQRDGSVRLWVADNGIGIASEDRERIFQPFERLHGQEAYPGTGIGLAIVRRSIERMAGRFGVESEVGAGSRFWIELPAA